MSYLHDTESGAPGRPSFYQRRVGVLGKVLTIVWLVGNLASASIYVAMGWWREYFTAGTALSWFALLICFTVWMVCRPVWTGTCTVDPPPCDPLTNIATAEAIAVIGTTKVAAWATWPTTTCTAWLISTAAI